MSGTREQILASHPFLAGLPEGTTELVAGCSHLVSFEPGRLLVAEGDEADTLYLIHQGLVSVVPSGSPARNGCEARICSKVPLTTPPPVPSTWPG